MKRIFLLFLFIFAISCSGNLLVKKQNFWEGFNGNILRIYVRYSLADKESDEFTEKDVNRILLQLSNERAFKIIASYLRINIHQLPAAMINSIDKKIRKIIRKAKKIKSKCWENKTDYGYENVCSAFYEYNILEIKKIVKEINKNER